MANMNLDENEVLRDMLSGLSEDVPPMPENLHAAWMQKVEDDMNETKSGKTSAMKTLTRWLSVAAAVVFVFGGTLLTRDYLNSAHLRHTLEGSYEDLVEENEALLFRATKSTDYEAQLDALPTDNGVMLTMTRSANNTAGAGIPAATDKKIIRSASITIATQTYDDSLQALRASCEAMGGWIEHSSESVNGYSDTRTVWMTLRIPQESLDEFLSSAAGTGRVLNRSESAQDVTAAYQDTQARLNTQLALMERLQALITESADLTDLLALESQIADTQYQIDTLQSSLNDTDRQVAYSTVNITLQEEQTVQLSDTTVPFGQRISSAFRIGWEALTGFLGDVVVFLVAAFPFIIIVAAAVIVITFIRKRRSK